MVDLEARAAHGLEVEGPAVDRRRRERVLALARAGDEAAAVEPVAPALADEPELNREPEESREALGVVRVVRGERCLAVRLQEVGEHRVRVERHVPEDVVEDVRLRQVVDRLLRPDHDGGRELAAREAREERLRGQVPGHGLALPARERHQERVDRLRPLEERDVVAHQLDARRAVEVHAARVLGQELHLAVVQDAPGLLVLLGVARVVLPDVRVFLSIDN